VKPLLFLITLLTLVSCGGGSQKHIVDNPYAERMKELSRNGVIAMQRERWLPAEKLFERALESAQLANDPALIAQAWYNLGVLHLSTSHIEKGEDALTRAVSVAQRHGLNVVLMRSRLAMALSRQKRGISAWQPGSISGSMPLDLHLSAARLAQLQRNVDVARDEYRFVLDKRGDDRATLLYKIDAHMGLALLAEEQGDLAAAKQELSNVLRKSRGIGSPRMAAHALLLNARLSGNETSMLDDLQDALAIYHALKDVRGQKDVLDQLVLLAEKQGDEEAVASWRARLRSLEND